MSSSSPRWAIVDDTSTDIQYLGPWFEDASGSQDSEGNFGPVFEETLHGTKNDSSFSFAFTGSAVKLFGSNNLLNDSGIIDPQWECFVDGISVGNTSQFGFQFPENNWPFCDSGSKLSDGPHVLTVNATIAKAQTFWVDQIQYLPSADASEDNLLVLVDSLDPQLTSAFGDGWGALGSTANFTSKTGSIFAFDFIGISLSWYGFIPNEFAITATTGTYAIDGQAATTFLLKGLPSNTTATTYNQKFFETATLTPGKHELVVTYQGSSATTPLTLDYMVIQNVSVSSTTTSAGSASTSSSTALSSGSGSASGSKSNIGAIVGGVVGGVVIIALAFLAYLYLRRRNKQSAAGIYEKDIDESIIPRPFIYAPVSPTETEATSLGRERRRGASETTNTVTSRHLPSQPSLSLTEFSQSQSGVTPTTATFSSLGTNVNTLGHHASQPLHVAGFLESQALQSSSRNEKSEVEAAATLAALRPQRQDAGGTGSLSSSLSDGIPPSRYVHYADSGIRMAPVQEAEHVVEVPPEYTAS